MTTLTPTAPGQLATVSKPRTGSILRSERIKFLSTRSPWWCMALTAVLAIGFGMLVAGTSDFGENRIYYTLGGMGLAQSIVMIMATIAITSEYRFGTIRTTFQLSPNRTRVLWTKAAMVGGAAAVFGEILAFATFYLAKLVAKDDHILEIHGGTAWRQVAGHGLVYAIAAIIALGVGAIIRQTAGAVSLILVWTLLVENLVTLIPNVGQDIYRWMPFVNGTLFAADPEFGGDNPLSPWPALGVFAATGLIIMLAATVVVRRRDA